MLSANSRAPRQVRLSGIDLESIHRRRTGCHQHTDADEDRAFRPYAERQDQPYDHLLLGGIK